MNVAYKDVKQNYSGEGTKWVREEIPCPLCGSSRYTVKYTPTIHINDPCKLYGAASGITGTQRIVQCADCSLIYENPRLPEEAIIYGYKSANNAGHDSQHQMRVASFYKALVKLKKYLPDKGADVLDIGTAGGAFLEAAGQFGYNAMGIEPSTYLAKSARNRGLDVVEGTIEDCDLGERRFDLICMWDVLEHVVDPVRMLKETKRYLKPNGIVLINYPDIGTWQARLAGKHFWWLLSVHVVHFSRETIDLLAQKSGFKIFLFAPYWQTLELGYLQDIAIHLNVPLAKVTKKLTPAFLQRLPIPYYASQTTALMRVK